MYTSTGAFQLWLADQEFMRMVASLQGKTLVDVERCHVLYQLAKRALKLPGAAAEIGVYKGGTARLLSEVFGKNKKLYLYDTFEGMPECSAKDNFCTKGMFSDTSLEAVQAFVGNAGDVEIYKGFFPQTIPPTAEQVLSFVHVDVDIYQSVKDCVDYFWPRLTSGGVMVFDDYGFPTCLGARRAVDEYGIDTLYLGTGQALWIK